MGAFGGFGRIPAHAGKTHHRSPRARDRWAHPRSRGENSRRDHPLLDARGASPLTRGKLSGHVSRPSRRGRIPAHAGKTETWTCTPPPKRAHPRSRGENSWDATQQVQGSGASPLTRGKPKPTSARSPRTGRIPAHAGKTAPTSKSSTQHRAHPRSRGENPRLVPVSRCTDGASPLTRGKLLRCGGLRRTRRRIPAHAGKTPARRRWRAGLRAHPRSRGENASMRMDVSSELGASPLTRGKLTT